MNKKELIGSNFTSDIVPNSSKACIPSNDMNFYSYPRLPILSLLTTFNKDTQTCQRGSIKVRCKAKLILFVISFCAGKNLNMNLNRTDFSIWKFSSRNTS